jgi:nucleoside-diphosphate-sugar epimerase
VAVTGATGNIGSVVAGRLLAAGHQVTGVCRRSPARDGVGHQVRWVELDLTAPDRRERLRAAFTGVDSVVHTAWGFQPTRNTAYLHRLDVGGTAAVLAAAADCEVDHLVHVSSVGAYSPGRDVGPVEEDWPTDGFPWLPYSRHKSAAERLLDAHESGAQPRLPRVARVRPSLVARESVGGALDRYVLPSLLPAAALRALPVLPLDRAFRVQLTHTSDVAAGICAVVEQRATGAYNLAAEPVLTRADVARAFGVPAVHLPWRVLRALAAAAWTARVQPVDPGWLDMAWDVPVLSSRRAREELGWSPRHDARDVLDEVVRGLVRQTGVATPALRPRRWPEQLSNLVRHGPVSRRHRA